MKMKRPLTPGKVLLIGGGLFVLIFGACAISGAFGGNSLWGLALTFAVVNIGILIVTVALAIVMAVSSAGTPSDYTLFNKRGKDGKVR